MTSPITARRLSALLVASFGTGALLHAADAQLPASPFLVPAPGKEGAGTVPATTGNGAAVPPDTGPQFSGFVDSTYTYNIGRPLGGVNQYYAFESQANSFMVNCAQLELTGAVKGDAAITYMLKLNYGTDATAETAGGGSATAPASQLDVEEAWGAYVDPVSHIGVKVGKFVSYEGIESIESLNDPTITRGLLFSLAEPDTHTGALLTWAGSVVDLAGGVVNGWDELTATNSGKTALAKMGINGGDPLTVTIAALYGPERTGDASDKRGSLDVTGLTKVIPKVDLNVEANYGWEKNALGFPNALGLPADHHYAWFGAGLQPVIHTGATSTLAFRLEIFDDLDGARTGVKQRLVSLSVCPGYNVTPHFLLRAEGRLDLSNEDVYLNHLGVVNQKLQSTLAAEAIFNF